MKKMLESIIPRFTFSITLDSRIFTLSLISNFHSYNSTLTTQFLRERGESMNLKQLLNEMTALRSNCIGCSGLTDLAKCVTCQHEIDWQKINIQAQILVSSK